MNRTRIILLATVAIIIAAVCIRLGFWQLDRLEERRAENARIATGLAAAPIRIEEIGADSSRSRAQRVDVRGVYDFEHEITLINRSRDGSPGVNILTPLRIPGRDTAVMVNRGWVYSPDGATVDLARWREPPEARGTAYVSWLGTVTTANDAGVPTESGPRRVLRAGREGIARFVPYPIAPYQLILIDGASSEGEPGSVYATSSQQPLGTAVVDPTRPVRIPLPALDEGPHKSYALQWFAFAAIALIGTAAVIRKERSRTL